MFKERSSVSKVQNVILAYKCFMAFYIRDKLHSGSSWEFE